MKTQTMRQALATTCLVLISATMTGCWHVKPPDPVFCGNGTLEKMVGQKRTCVVARLDCGNGTQEQATGGQRECSATGAGNLLKCGMGTHQQEQATGGQRECVPDTATTLCGTGEIEFVKDDGTLSCRPDLLCANGTYEQATGGQRECVPSDSNIGCGNGTHEQATGGQRECQTN